MNFNTLKQAVAKQFKRMTDSGQMFRVDLDKEKLWSTYLISFPVGSNPMLKERTEHDCTCCKQFIRAVGDCVAIIDGKVETVWGVLVNDEPEYQAVANAMNDYVSSFAIKDYFVHFEATAGTDKNFGQLASTSPTIFYHFFVNIPPQYVVQYEKMDTILADKRTTAEMFGRALSTINSDSVNVVLDLIAQNSIYRGEEHKWAVESFGECIAKYEFAANKPLYVWQSAGGVPQSVSRIRNTVIGSLLVDLSEGKDLVSSVASFEQKVAPTNYKRPSAPVTSKMVELARNEVETLGLTTALQRRYAVLDDISINEVLYADRSVAKQLGAVSVFDEVAKSISVVQNFDNIEEMAIDNFLANVVPRAKSIEVLLENKHVNNLVSLVAPVDPTALSLFKWGNNFSWSYNGEVADAVRERVKKAGGVVDADLCCRLAWFNHDDLDLSVVEPNGGRIYFGTKGRLSGNGGTLDVDMNVADPVSDPVENIFYASAKTMDEGVYTVFVHNFNQRTHKDPGFTIDLDFKGSITNIEYNKVVRNGEQIQVAEFTYSRKNGVVVISSLSPHNSGVSKSAWGLPTNSFHRVNAIMRSPNFWSSNPVGNKHTFFMLQNCVNDGGARGFYNEFLDSKLDKHRRTLELVSSKTKLEQEPNQMSGLGFSSTLGSSLVCKVSGSFNRTIRVIF